MTRILSHIYKNMGFRDSCSNCALILLLLAVYQNNFELIAEERSAFQALFNSLSPFTQGLIEKLAPHFIAAIKSAQK